MDAGFAYAWLVPALPLLSFAIVGLFIAPRSRQAAGLVATASVLAATVIAVIIAAQYYVAFPSGGDAIIAWSFAWLEYAPGLTATIGVLLDPISVLLLVVVTVVSLLVHIYSLGYMADDPGSGRYFTFLNLFTFSMLGLVVAPNILQMFICWELVGVSSFLLIGYYYQKPSAVAASKKAFIVTRFADVFFLIGILLLGYQGFQVAATVGVPDGMQVFDFLFLTAPSTVGALGDASLLTIAMVLVFIGAAGKSAMFPLHIWLPDAMEGPTPVSALIHAATMVVAGIYLVARLFPAFAGSADALSVAMIVGAFTCLFAAVIACTQNDIKRVLAFSTLSQLGYMMFALGVATLASPLGYAASLFHLFTHAFFKALLFLGAGAVIHAVHSNSIWEMGGLARRMPVTHVTFLIATLAIAGLPPLAGFFSKDLILAAALVNHHPVVFAVGLLVAALTAFYMGRIYIVAFLGKARSDSAEKAHEASPVMLAPLLILAVLSLGAGFIPVTEFVGLPSDSGHDHHGPAWLPYVATAAGLAGLLIAWVIYRRPTEGEAEATGWRVVLQRQFYSNEVYLFVTKRIIFPFVSAPIAWFDRHVVDGAVNLTGNLTRWSGIVLSRLQTGQLQTYATWFVGGVVVIGLLFWWWVR